MIAGEEKAAAQGAPGSVLYFYGIMPAGQRLPEASGVALGAIIHGSLAAIVEPVSAVEFAPAALEAQMQSLEWIARLARKHELLLEAAMASGPVIPARLCTLFSDVDAVVARLSEDEAQLSSTLDRLGGQREWGLKIYCDEARLAEALAEGDPESASLAAAAVGASPGRSYILTKKRAARAEELAAQRIEDAREEVLATLEEMRVDICVKELLPAQAVLRPETMIANLALLAVPSQRDAIERVLEEVGGRLGEGALLFELSGPWPAYSFTAATDEGEVE